MPGDDHSNSDFLRLFAAHQPQLFGYVMSLVGNWHDAEEIVQETSVRAWESFGDFQPGTNFGAWLYKVAYHQVLALRKRNARSPLLMSDSFLEAITVSHERLAGPLSRQIEALAGCVDKLPSRDRELIERCYAKQAKIKDVAQQMDRPAGTIYKQLFRIRHWLLTCIDRRLAAEDRP